MNHIREAITTVGWIIGGVFSCAVLIGKATHDASLLWLAFPAFILLTAACGTIDLIRERRASSGVAQPDGVGDGKADEPHPEAREPRPR